MAVERRLPHAYPFKFISRDEGEGTLQFLAASGDAVSRGGAVPPWVILEALTQAAGLLAASGERSGGVLVQVARYRCVRPVFPGDRLDLTGELLHRMGPLLRVKVAARRKGRLVARGVLTLRETGA
jgi:acyl dehydratase